MLPLGHFGQRDPRPVLGLYSPGWQFQHAERPASSENLPASPLSQGIISCAGTLTFAAVHTRTSIARRFFACRALRAPIAGSVAHPASWASDALHCPRAVGEGTACTVHWRTHPTLWTLGALGTVGAPAQRASVNAAAASSRCSAPAGPSHIVAVLACLAQGTVRHRTVVLVRSSSTVDWGTGCCCRHMLSGSTAKADRHSCGVSVPATGAWAASRCACAICEPPRLAVGAGRAALLWNLQPSLSPPTPAHDRATCLAAWCGIVAASASPHH